MASYFGLRSRRAAASARWLSAAVLWFASGAAGQIPIPKPSGAEAPAERPADPLNRQTPRSTVFGFLQSVQLGEYTRAARYLQMSAEARRTKGEDLAQQLQVVLNARFKTTLDRISNQPEGRLEDAVNPDLEVAGPLGTGPDAGALMLARVKDDQYGHVWLVSSATLAELPAIYVDVELTTLEQRIPEPLRMKLLGVELWQILGFLLLLPAAWGLASLALTPIAFLVSFATKGRASLGRPVWSKGLVAIWIHHACSSWLALPILFRSVQRQILLLSFALWVLLLVWRAVDWATSSALRRAGLENRTSMASLVTLGRRVAKALTFLIALILVLTAFGFNMSAALAGLGIGGIAIALASQKTIENLFGGVSVATDRTIHVGDVCRFGTIQGEVTDIGLRSTRLRTPERVEVSIPNGVLANMTVENLSMREKILFNPVVQLRYETSPDQLRAVLADLRQLLYGHPKVETDTARVRFANFGASSLDLQVFAYLLTVDFVEQAALREDLLLRIMEIVNASGTGFAFPSQTLYLARDGGLDADRTADAERRVREWRAQGTLPFPESSPEQIRQARDRIPYPSPESAMRARE